MGSVAGAEGDPDAFEFFEETDEDLVPPREDPGGAGRDPGRAGQPVRDSLTRGPCKVPTADARDGRRGNQPWSVITTPVSA